MVENPPCSAGHAGSIPGRGTKMPHASRQLSLQGLHQNNPRDTAKIPMCCNQDPTKIKKKVKKKNFFLKRETPGSSLLLLQVRML